MALEWVGISVFPSSRTKNEYLLCIENEDEVWWNIKNERRGRCVDYYLIVIKIQNYHDREIYGV